ncbi:MAG TPA: DNA-processing protein DprA [Candidatus Methylomirabilis sp.]|nr:DNA-processing protein DprA [Candidatus Methylomirabilis sp.]
MELDSSLSWLALALTPGLASRLSARLLKRFGSPDAVFRAPLTDLEACSLPAPVAQAVYKKEAFHRAEKELKATANIDRCRLINWTEPEYPQTLLQIYDPPVLLYVRGDAQVLNLPSLSIVGTRRPTLYGTQMADRLGRELTARGLVIVSGLARGIDAIGHQGAVAANGRAIGVLGTGIDVCYPKENRKLYEKVLERGAIISEFPLHTHPAPENFPVRNRIVAGLPLGVIVVEGAQYSGSLITARLAMEFGREVFGVPGNVTQAVSFAPNQLIKQGAKLVTNADDVIEELPTPVRAALVKAAPQESAQKEQLVAAALNGVEKKVYDLLSADESKHIDDVVEQSGLNSSEVLATLFDLEMKGLVRQSPGKLFSKVLF